MSKWWLLLEDVLMAVSIIKAKAIMNRTSLEWPTLPVPIVIGFKVLMEFGWIFVASVRPGVVLPVFMMLLFQLDQLLPP